MVCRFIMCRFGATIRIISALFFCSSLLRLILVYICSALLDVNEFVVQAGVHDVSATTTTDQHQERKVKEIHVHPDVACEVYNDIALLRLHSPLNISQYIKPICVAQHALRNGTECLTSGWGRTAGSGTPGFGASGTVLTFLLGLSST